MYLLITSSRGLFKYNLNSNSFKKIISNWHKGYFKKPSKGFFGICLDDNSNIITVSRESLYRNREYEKSTSTIVHIINKNNFTINDKIVINELFDVHQIAYYDNFLYLTETGKNRVQILNINEKKVDRFINIGNIREDRNHVNSISIDNGTILIGLNNGHEKNIQKNSQVLKILVKNLQNFKNFDGYENGSLFDLIDVYHTHDMEKYENDYLISSSYLGKIYKFKEKKFIKDIKPWTRGIAISNKHIYIGKSRVSKRKLRHSPYYDGELYILDKKNLNIIDKINLPSIGQLNDMIFIQD